MNQSEFDTAYVSVRKDTFYNDSRLHWATKPVRIPNIRGVQSRR